MGEVLLNADAVELPGEDLSLLGWLRDRGLIAAKPVCLGGDCGACQVLVGEVEQGSSEVRYRAMNSCLLTTGLVEGRQVVTVEGLEGDNLTPVQQALVDAGAVQCGYCTPGFVIALTGALLNRVPPMGAASGNLCRCTGYGGLRRAADMLAARFPNGLGTDALPEAVVSAASALRPRPRPRGGHTDAPLRPRDRTGSVPLPFDPAPDARAIATQGSLVVIGAGVTVAELLADPLLQEAWPMLAQHLELFGSPAVREAATVGGNLANASPAADLAVVLLALGADLALDGPTGRRSLPLARFHLAYRRTALRPGEVIVEVSIPRNPDGRARLHAEKVCRRRHDDVASVCSAMVVDDGAVTLAAGGVAPVPLLLPATARALGMWPPDADCVRAALAAVPGEIRPIDDLRGSASYKTRLLQHQVLAHVAALDSGFDPLEHLP